MVLEVVNEKTCRERFIRAWKTGTPAKQAYISFGTLELRELSRCVGRDVKAVHTDTRIPLNADVIDRTDEGKRLFPYRHIKAILFFQTTSPFLAN